MFWRRSPIVCLERAVRFLLCVTVFMMMAVTAVDVFARYVFSTPLRGAFEIVTLLLASSAFLALPLVTRANEHITVDFLGARLRGRLAAIHRSAINLVCCGAFGVIAFQLWRHAQLLASGGQVTGFLEWPLAPVVYLMATMSAVTMVVYGAIAVESMRSGPAPRPGRSVET